MLFSLIATSLNLKIFDRINGVSNFANNIKTSYLEKKEYLIVEDRLLFSSLSYYLKNSNINILMPYQPTSKIKNHFHLSKPLKPEHDKNFIFIGNTTSINYLEKKFYAIKKENLNVKFFNRTIEIYEVLF